MKILIVGNGGREHALLWKLHRDAPSAEFSITRGNGGTAPFATHLPFDPADIGGIATWASGEHVDLAVIGPEAPLAEGLADTLQQRGVPAFGPSRQAVAIEASKAFAKDVMRQAGVPTAEYEVFADAEGAQAYIRARGAPIVVKASGLAAGKGAIVCNTEEEALHAVDRMLREHDFGQAGQQVVIEERMMGEELSVFALTDGRDVALMKPSQDHKRAGEGDTGPNTGGMGAYAPVRIATDELLHEVRERILLPTLEEMRRRDRTFRGLLYAGLMLTSSGPRVVEFNARFGDPEAQVVLPIMESSLLEPIRTIAGGGSVRGLDLEWKPSAAVTTVLASGGYPGSYTKGREITIPAGLEDEEELLVFHAGTSRKDGRLITSGGRVLAVTGLGATVADAAIRSREGAERVEFQGRQFRRDIAWREIERAGTS